MADDPTDRGAQDPIRVNVNEPHELRYWAKHFRVTEDELRRAVEAVGVDARDVEKRLAGSEPE